MTVKELVIDTSVDATDYLIIDIDGIWTVEDFVKIFGGLMYVNRLLNFCEQINTGYFDHKYPYVVASEEVRSKVLRELTEAHNVDSRPISIDLPGGGHSIILDPLRVVYIHYGSPGKIVLIGASGILKEIRKFYEFNALSDQRRKMSAVQVEVELEVIKSKKIENLKKSIDVLKKLGFRDEEIRALLQHGENWMNVFIGYQEDAKIKKIEVRSEDDPPDPVEPL